MLFCESVTASIIGIFLISFTGAFIYLSPELAKFRRRFNLFNYIFLSFCRRVKRVVGLLVDRSHQSPLKVKLVPRAISLRKWKKPGNEVDRK